MGVLIKQSGVIVNLNTAFDDGSGNVFGNTGSQGVTITGLFEQTPGATTLKQYDFNDNTFKTTAPTTPTLAMTEQLVTSAHTGIWSSAIAFAGFTAGRTYFATCKTVNDPLGARLNRIEFQYGGVEGDSPTTTNLKTIQAILYGKRVRSIVGSTETIAFYDPASSTTLIITGTIVRDASGNITQATWA